MSARWLMLFAIRPRLSVLPFSRLLNVLNCMKKRWHAQHGMDPCTVFCRGMLSAECCPFFILQAKLRFRKKFRGHVGDIFSLCFSITEFFNCLLCLHSCQFLITYHSPPTIFFCVEAHFQGIFFLNTENYKNYL